jgi:hypothetical protein
MADVAVSWVGSVVFAGLAPAMRAPSDAAVGVDAMANSAGARPWPASIGRLRLGDENVMQHNKLQLEDRRGS